MSTKKFIAFLLAISMFACITGITALANGTTNVWDGTVNTDWYTTAEAGTTSFTLSTAAELAGLAAIVNGTASATDTFQGKTITLASNLDLNNLSWTPIGKSGNPFSGTFDGGNFTIKNLYINTPYTSDVGLFGFTTAGTVKNFTIDTVNITGHLDVGAVAGTPYTSTYTDISVTGLIQVTGYAYVGGAFGKNVYHSITNIDVTGDAGSLVTADSNYYRTYVGGLVGFMGEGNITIADCDVKIDVNGSTCDIGGITGILHYGNKMVNCTFEGSLTLTDASAQEAGEIGGLAGTVLTDAAHTTSIESSNATVTSASVTQNGATVDITESISACGTFYSEQDKTNGVCTIEAAVNGNTETFSNVVARIGDKEYTTLATALATAKTGDIVEVFQAGTYADDIVIDKAITLQGAEDVIFSGTIKLTEAADGAVLDGINLHYEGMRTDTNIYGNIWIQASNVTVKNCNFYAAYDTSSTGIGSEFGMVWVPWTPENVVFDNCTFQTNTMGIFPVQKSGEIKNCTFKPLDEGDTRKSLAINSSNMEDVSITNNTFNGGRILTNAATITGNTFLDFTSKVVIWNTDPIDLSGNYWGSENPDFDTLIGTDGTLYITSYYTSVADDGTLESLVYIVDSLEDVSKQVTLEQVEGTNQINVYLEGITEEDTLAKIENLVAVDLNFAITGTFAITSFVPANSEWTYEITDTGSYLIHEKGMKDGAADLDGQKILLGTLTLEGYGDGTITAAADGDAVQQRSKDGQNLVISSVAESDTLAFTITVPTNTLTVNVTFPNNITDNAAAYQDMKATISGGDLAEDIVVNFGSDDEVALVDNAYTFTQELTENTTYTVTISGAGYRTTRYSVNMAEDKELTFWNNVMDEAKVIETGKDTSAVKTNFLAGDIVADNNINIYDLSAVVSYFGTINVTDAASQYAKYDLNRDGVIDSKDVALVLVSWGN